MQEKVPHVQLIAATCVRVKAEALITDLQPGIILPGIQGPELLPHLNITGHVPVVLITEAVTPGPHRAAEVPIQGLHQAAGVEVHIQDLQLQEAAHTIVLQAAPEEVTALLQEVQVVVVTVLLQGVQEVTLLQEVVQGVAIAPLQGVQEVVAATAGLQVVAHVAAAIAGLQVVPPEAADQEVAAQDLQAQEVAVEEDNINISYTGPAISGIFF